MYIKKIFYGIIMLLALTITNTAFPSCDTEDVQQETLRAPYAGVWKFNQLVNGTNSQGNITLTLNTNGYIELKVEDNEQIAIQKGKYKVGNNELNVTWDNGKTETVQVTYKTSNTLTLRLFNRLVVFNKVEQ